jgi:hypothetical protein
LIRISASRSKNLKRVLIGGHYGLRPVFVTEEQLGSMLGERLQVQRFIEKKIGLFVRVSRDEAEKYFNDHPDQFKGKRFQEVQKAITAVLSERKLEQHTAKYVDELRSKAEIRMNP